VVVTAFLGDIPGIIAALETSLATLDRGGAQRHAHSIKGASASVGADVMCAAAAAIEAACATGRLDEARARASELGGGFKAFRAVAQ